MAQKKNQHQESHQRETIHDKFAIFCKIGKAKIGSIGQGEQNMYEVGYVLKEFL